MTRETYINTIYSIEKTKEQISKIEIYKSNLKDEKRKDYNIEASNLILENQITIMNLLIELDKKSL